MPGPHVVVIGIMGRGNLDTTATQLRLGPRIRDERHSSIQQRQPHLTPLTGHLSKFKQGGQMRLASALQALDLFGQSLPVPSGSARQTLAGLGNGGIQCTGGVGVTSHGGIAQHGLRSGGSYHDMGGLTRLRVNHGVAEKVKMALYGVVDNLIIGYRGLQLAIPVDQTIAPKNQPVAKHVEKRPAHRPSTYRVHGKALAVPIARASHTLLLLDNAPLVLLFPLPNAPHQPITTDIVAGLPLQFEQPLLHHCLGCNASVIRTGHPQGIISLHTMPTD